jgi:hypothetical protein
VIPIRRTRPACPSSGPSRSRTARSRLAGGAVVAATLALVLPAGAGAQQSDDVALNLGGSPMNVGVGARGQLQALMLGQPQGIYFAPSDPVGDAGFFLAFPEGSAVPEDVDGLVFGFEGSAGPDELAAYTPVSQSGVTGAGTAEDPLRLVTRYDAAGYDGTAAEVTQTTTYVNGEGRYRARWEVKNVSGAPLNLRALVGADFYFDGDDRGTGVFTAATPRFIGGTNIDTGRSGGFEESTGAGAQPWSHYQALPFGNATPGTVWNTIEGAAAAGATGFDDSVVGEQVDNAGGVQWDQYASGSGLEPGATAAFEVVGRAAIPATLQLTPPNATTQQGTPIAFGAAITDTDGAPIFVGRTLRYDIAGANPGGGAATIGPDGRAVIADPATNLGTDTVVAYVDLNGDAVRDPAEPQASVVGTVVDTIPATCAVKIDSAKVGGGGGKDRPLLLNVTCDSAATVTGTARLSVRIKRVTSTRKRGKRVRRTRTVKRTVALKPQVRTVAAGVPTEIRFRLPKAKSRAYAKKSALALLRLDAGDQVGNRSSFKASRMVKIVKYTVVTKKKRRRG